MTRVQVDCSISGDLKARIQNRLSGPVRTTSAAGVAGAFVVCISTGIQLTRSVVRHLTAMTVIYGLLLAAAIALVAGSFVLPRLPRRWPFATRIRVAIDDSGISGTLDGRPISYAWRDVTSVADVGEALIILTRTGPFGKRLLILKAALPDPAALWTELDNRLVAKRGLAGARTVTRIVNTAH